MFFDTDKAIAKIRSGIETPATIATLRHESPDSAGKCRNVASVAMTPDRKLDPDRLSLAHNHFQERAAIRQFDGGQSRADSEAAALREAAETWGVAPEHILKIATERKSR